MSGTVDKFVKARQEKRWMVLTSIANSGLYRSNGSGGYTLVTGEEGWLLDSEVGSFDLAKKRVVELSKTIGLDSIRVCRPVDLYTVLYPIS